MNFNSSNIKIYPTSKRKPIYDYTGNLNIEQNIVSLSNNIVDYENYIVDGLDLKIESEVPKLEKGTCVIKGYVININQDQTLTSLVENSEDDEDNKIYLKLKPLVGRTFYVEGVSYTVTELDGIDEEEQESSEIYKYTGIEILNNIQLDSTCLLLGTIVKNGNDYTIKSLEPKNKKFNLTSTYIDNITDIKDAGLTDLDPDIKEYDANKWFIEKFIVDDGNI